MVWSIRVVLLILYPRAFSLFHNDEHSVCNFSHCLALPEVLSTLQNDSAFLRKD